MRTPNNPIVNNDVVKRILETMEKRGIRQKDLMDHIGIADTVFAKWKYGNGKSYMNYIDSIAQYLCVTPDYLITGNLNPYALQCTNEEEEMIKAYRILPDEMRASINKIIVGYASTLN